MENRTNQVIKLKNGKEFLILRQVIYKTEIYYVTSEIFENEGFDQDIKIFKETVGNGNINLSVVNNQDVIKIITKYIE